ncbi:MAG: RecX family transcriptional regulator [Candidatus Cloacimonadaceae bacterium]|nr:RecX family transcriptional regulator [Candidatus Cloacimonadaceae bacterium]
MILKLQKKSEKDYKIWIYLDSELWGILPARILHSRFQIPCEIEISDDSASEITSLLTESARQRILEYLAKFERSTHQCRDILQRHRYHHRIISSVIDEVTSLGYLDDTRFTEILVRSLADRGKSRRYIINKLYLQSIPSAIYDPFLAEFLNPTDLKENLKSEVSRLKSRYRDLPTHKQREKIVSSLYRKGFELDDILSSLGD